MAAPAPAGSFLKAKNTSIALVIRKHEDNIIKKRFNNSYFLS